MIAAESPTKCRSKRLVTWAWRRRWRTVTILFVGGFLLLNVLAYLHASSMLTFGTAHVAATASPQSLSVLQKAQVLVCGVSVPRPELTRLPTDLDLPSETIRFESDDGVGLEGWLIAPPRSRGTVLLFHGYSASRSSLLRQARAFYDLGYAAAPIDFRGSGGSEGNVTTLGYREALDVAAAVRYVRERNLPRPLILFGQSMGGAAVLRSVAALDVEPDAIIVESVFGRMLDTVRNRFALMGVPSFPAAQLLVYWGGVQVGFSAFDHNPVEYARHCDCPALVLHGADDLHARLAEANEVYDNLACDKQMEVFDGVAHASLITVAPDQWRLAIEKFLATIKPNENLD